jgi:hypothetical protein
MKHNGLNMVRLAFQRSKFSIYCYFYLLLSSLILALSAKCTIFFVTGRNYYSTNFLNVFSNSDSPFFEIKGLSAVKSISFPSLSNII